MVLSPLMLMLALAVKLSSPAPSSTGNAGRAWRAANSACSNSAACASTPNRRPGRSGPSEVTTAARGSADSSALGS